MEHWNKLKVWQKFIIGFALIASAFVMPELMFFYDIGGFELMFGFLLMYIESVKAYFFSKLNAFRQFTHTLYVSIHSTLVTDRKAIGLQMSFCALSFFVTGSLVFSACFLYPALLLPAVS